jgi:hypothetical protein
MNKCTAKLLLLFYILLCFILVSLKQTYTFTKGIFASKKSHTKYGSGMELSQSGFVLHALVFTALVAVPFYFVKEYT